MAYALIIGIGQYHHINPLQKTTTDAQDLYDLLLQQGYPERNVSLLLDDQATKSFISDRLDWLARRASGQLNGPHLLCRTRRTAGWRSQSR